ncbi:12944_t:CDS:2 [Funneliformis caledonium]|uniref:12944_t:CDS:1 n=1 Tax=Funneliformis caledonium TaxID=1117310 RepID=A0A9N9BKL9_9GLOM|nr:12944_t:CDS:2 [Funneliformis caledonium]
MTVKQLESCEKKSRILLFSSIKIFQRNLDNLIPYDQMPFKNIQLVLSTKKLIDRSINEFRQRSFDVDIPLDIADVICKNFSDTIKSQVAELKEINELSLNSTEQEYSRTCKQLLAEYVVKLYNSLRGEPEMFETIITKCTADIMKKYDKKIASYPEFIIKEHYHVFKNKLNSKNKKFRIEYNAYLKQYMKDFKKKVKAIHKNVFHEYKLEVNVKIPNIPMSLRELDILLYDRKDKYHSLFDTKTAALSGQREASKAYIQRRKNILVESINEEQENMSRYNQDASKECCNNIWDKKVQPICDKVKKGDYDSLEKFQKELNTFEHSYRNEALGPEIDTVWKKRFKAIDSWKANIKRSFMAVPYNHKNIETIYNEIMKSTLTPIDRMAEHLGLAWAGSGHYRRTARGYTWDCTRKDVNHKNKLPSYVLYDFKSGLKDLITSDPIIEYVNPREIDISIYGPYPTDTTITRKVDYSVTEQLIWECSKKFSFNQEASASYKQGVKEIWEASISLKFGFSQELFNKDGGTKTITRTESAVSDIFIPAGKRVQVTSISYDQSVTINYIAIFNVSASLRMEGVLLWGAESPEKNYHQDFQEGGTGNHWSHDFGDITEIYDQMMQNREPWLWDECKRDNPELTSILGQLKDPKKYEFIVSGKFNGVNGVRVEDKVKILR